MKIKTFIFALIVLGFSACTQKLCPTYAKNDVQNTEKTVPARI